MANKIEYLLIGTMKILFEQSEYLRGGLDIQCQLKVISLYIHLPKPPNKKKEQIQLNKLVQ